MTKLSPAEAYQRHLQSERRNAAIERQRADYQEDIARLLELYANGSLRRPGTKPERKVKEATSYTTTRLAGGLESSLAADKAAKTRRDRRAARKAQG